MKHLAGATAFVAVINNGGFSAAASALGISTAAVSRSVKNLESELGIQLVNRSTRRLSLTDEGSIFFECCHMALLDLENAANAIVERRHGPTGVLRITSAVIFGRRYVLPVLAEFAERYPNITIDLTLDDSFSDMIRERYEVSIRVDTCPRTRLLVAKCIAPVHAVVCGSPAYFANFPEPRSLTDLTDHNCIRFRSLGSSRILRWEFQDDGKIVFKDVQGKLILSDMEGICQACVDGHGLAQLPGFLATSLIKTAQLKPVMLNYLSQSRAIYICYPIPKHMSLRTRIFVDFLADKLSTEMLEISSFTESNP